MRFIILIISIFSFLISFSQEKEKKIIEYHLFEQIHLNTDRETYLSGETIWFKINTYEGNLKIPVNLSKIAYIELFNQDNIAIQQEKIFLQNGIGSGYIKIPRHLQTNYYYIRAYTNYMKNYGCESFYHQRINVINPFIKIKNKDRNLNIIGPLNISYYPEGGFILNYQENLIVYKVTDNDGNGLNFKGYLTNSNGAITDSIQTLSNGFGYFNFNPDNLKSYFIVYYINNEEYKSQIPKIQANGIKLKVKPFKDSIRVLLVSNNEITLPLKLTAYYPGLEYKIKDIYNNKGIITLSKNNFYSGTCELKLYSNNELLSARPIYITNNKNLEINISTNKSTYEKREKVDLEINVNSDTNTYISSNLGISVSLFNNNGQLFEPLHKKYSFTSQYNKIIHSTANNNPDLLNTLILASKQHIIFSDSITFLPESHGDILKGVVFDDKSNKPKNNTVIYQCLIDSVGQLQVSKTKQNGEFYFILEKYNNNADLVISVKDTSSKYKIKIENEFYDKFCKIVKETYIPDNSLDDFIKRKMINIQVNDAYTDYIPNFKNTFNDKEINFYGDPDVSYHFSDYIKLPNVDEFIFEIVHGVIIVRRNKKRKIRVISNFTQGVIGENPLIILDGLPVDDHTAVLKLRPEKLKSISAVLEQYFYYDQKYDGIIDINLCKLNLPVNSIKYELKGTQRGIKFPEITNNRIPNYSDALYWNGNLITNKKGKVNISFYTGDLPGTYIIKCFGYSENGIYGTNFDKKIKIE